MPAATVLVIEDEALVAMHLESCLKEFGYLVYCASSGEEALELAARHRPQLALTDIRLAGAMDGIATAAQLRQLGIPAVFLTAYADETTIERAKAAEPLGYLVKPFRERELRATLEVALRRCAIERRLRARQQWQQAMLDTIREPVIMTDATGRVVWLNRAAETMTGRAPEDAQRLPLAELWPDLEPAALQRLKESVRSAARQKSAVELTEPPLRICTGSGEYAAEGVIPMLDEAGLLQGTVLVFRDCSPAKSHPEPFGSAESDTEDRAPSLAVDPQTGLPGRAEAERAFAQLHRQGSRAFAGVFVIDHFKTIVQRYGFQAAEEIILFFSVHLAQGLAGGGQLYRWTGPAFVVLLERLDSIERVRRDVAGLASLKLEKVLQLKARTALLVVSAAWEVFPIYASSSVEQLVRQIDAFAAAHCW